MHKHCKGTTFRRLKPVTIKIVTDPTYHSVDWIGFCSVLRPHQHSIGYLGDGFHRSKDPTNSIKVLKEKAVKENNPKKQKKKQKLPIYAYAHKIVDKYSVQL